MIPFIALIVWVKRRQHGMNSMLSTVAGEIIGGRLTSAMLIFELVYSHKTTAIFTFYL